MALPSGYTKLDYIESSGTQYIDTGVSSFNTQRTRVILDVDWLSGLGCYFGCYSSGRRWFVEALQPTKIYSGYLDEGKSADIATVIGRYTVDKNGVSTNVNGVKILHASAGNSTSISICLLACGGSSGVSGIADAARIYSCKIYSNSVLIRQFVPCKNSSGEVGLYDEVNDVFYGNAGTGVFIAGPEVPISGSGGGGKHKTLIAGTSYGIKSGRTLIGGTGYDIKKGRTLIGGTGYDIKLGVPVGELAVGSSVYMNVGGVRKKFIVINQGTASGGFYSGDAGATWVLMNEKYKEVQQKATSSGYFSNTPVYTDANTTFLNSLDVGVREQIASLTYPDMCYHFADTPATIYVTGKIVILRSQDLGEDGWADGETIPMNYFSNLNKKKRILYDADGTTALRWHLQDYSFNINSPYHRPRVIAKDGDIEDDGRAYITAIIRPAFAFNASTQIDSDFNIIPA